VIRDFMKNCEILIMYIHTYIAQHYTFLVSQHTERTAEPHYFPLREEPAPPTSAFIGASGSSFAAWSRFIAGLAQGCYPGMLPSPVTTSPRLSAAAFRSPGDVRWHVHTHYLRPVWPVILPDTGTLEHERAGRLVQSDRVRAVRTKKSDGLPGWVARLRGRVRRGEIRYLLVPVSPNLVWNRGRISLLLFFLVYVCM
jgi:hypothetical protein